MRSLPWLSFIFVRSSCFLFSIQAGSFGEYCCLECTCSNAVHHWAAAAGNGAAAVVWLCHCFAGDLCQERVPKPEPLLTTSLKMCIKNKPFAHQRKVLLSLLHNPSILLLMKSQLLVGINLNSLISPLVQKVMASLNGTLQCYTPLVEVRKRNPSFY